MLWFEKLPLRMDQGIAYRAGQFYVANQIAIPLDDPGFVLGTTVSERLRTFDGRLFRQPEHLERLSQSLSILGVAPAESPTRIGEICEEVVARNCESMPPGADLGLCILCAPSDMSSTAIPANLTVYSYQLAFATAADIYQNGQKLVVSQIRQVPAECWPPELKCRSRMHYYLADRQARAIDPQARALLLDSENFVTEASTANIIAHFPSEGLVSPRLEKVLPGISLGALTDIASELQIPVGYRDMSVEELQNADEVMLCSTSPCLMPVSAINDQTIDGGKPGPVFTQLMNAWSELVGIDIVQQAHRFA